MSENVAVQLKEMEEKLIKDRKRLKKKIRKEQDRERMRRGNEQLLMENSEEASENRPSKTVNFKDASPEVIKESEANCDELKNELEDLEHDPRAVLQELNPVNSDSTDSPDSQIIMPTQVTPVSRKKKIRRKRKAKNEPVNDSNDLCSENCFQFNGISLREEALDERDFQLPKEYTSMKLEKVRHDNVLNDSLQIDEDHDDVLSDSLQINEEDLSQSLLVKSRRRQSSLSEATNAFASDSNNTIIETSINSQSPPQIKSESMLLNEVVNLEEAINNSDCKSSFESSLEGSLIEGSQLDSSPTRKIKVRQRKPRRHAEQRRTQVGEVSDSVQVLICEKFQCEEKERFISGHVLCSVGDKFVTFWTKISDSEDQKWSKVAEISAKSVSLEAARTEPLLLIEKGNICLKIYKVEADTVVKDVSFVVLDFLDPPETVITAVHCVELISEVNPIERLLSVRVDQSTCGVFFSFKQENVSRGCSLRYSEEFCNTSVEHRVLASASGSLVSVKMVEGLPNCLVGVAREGGGVAEAGGGEEQMVIWNLESGLCVRTIKLDPAFQPPVVGLLKCVFRDDKLVIVSRVGWKIALHVLAEGHEGLVPVKTFDLDRSFEESSMDNLEIGDCLVKADVLIYKNSASICEWNIGSGKLLKIKRTKYPTVFVSADEKLLAKSGKLFVMN